jgi:predicted nucleic acid-binding protein
VRLAFDTSVLVASLVEPHPYHLRTIPWLEALAGNGVDGVCTWHAVAETWAVLTRMPIVPVISPALASLAVARLLERVTPVEVGGNVYRSAMERCAVRGLRSGVVFDGLHLVAAELAGADGFVTFNPRDFERLAIEGSPRIVVPPDPPRVLPLG